MVQVCAGRMTMFMALGRRVCDAVDFIAGSTTGPRLPRLSDEEEAA